MDPMDAARASSLPPCWHLRTPLSCAVPASAAALDRCSCSGQVLPVLAISPVVHSYLLTFLNEVSRALKHRARTGLMDLLQRPCFCAPLPCEKPLPNWTQGCSVAAWLVRPELHSQTLPQGQPKGIQLSSLLVQACRCTGAAPSQRSDVASSGAGLRHIHVCVPSGRHQSRRRAAQPRINAAAARHSTADSLVWLLTVSAALTSGPTVGWGTAVGRARHWQGRSCIFAGQVKRECSHSQCSCCTTCCDTELSLEEWLGGIYSLVAQHWDLFTGGTACRQTVERPLKYRPYYSLVEENTAQLGWTRTYLCSCFSGVPILDQQHAVVRFWNLHGSYPACWPVASHPASHLFSPEATFDTLFHHSSSADIVHTILWSSPCPWHARCPNQRRRRSVAGRVSRFGRQVVV